VLKKIKYSRYRPEQAQRVDRVIALSFPDPGAGGGWSAPRPGRFTPGKDPVPIIQKAGPSVNTELNSTSIGAWNTFQQTPRKFLGNEKFEIYSEKVTELISSQSVMWVNVFENLFSAFKFWFLSRKHGSFMIKA
jgi:hypothetical protein